MADSKITALTEEITPVGADLLVMVDDVAGTPTTKKTTISNLEAALSHTNIQNIGTNTHPQIDTHVASTSNPHSVTKAQVGLTNVTDNAQYYAGGTDVVAPNQDTTGKSAKTDALNSATTTVNVASATAPSSGQVLTATGSTAATWQTPAAGGGSTPRQLLNFDLHTEQISTTLTSGADANLSAPGRRVYTGTTAGAIAQFKVISSWAALTPSIFDLNPELQSLWMWQSSVATDSVTWLLSGTSTAPAQATGVLTAKHIGFITDTSTTYGSNANSTTQTLTSITGLSIQQDDFFRATMTSGTNVKFYYNGTLKGTSTTNLPSGALGDINGILNTGVRNDSGITTGRQTSVGFSSLTFDGE